MPDVAQVRKRGLDRMMVRIEHLDKLLNLAGEVIITSSGLHELQRTLQETASRRLPLTQDSLESIKSSNEAAQRISQDLHDLVMDIRLVEIGETLRLFRRPVRDLARSLGREVELAFEGESTMIDKALAERLVDPLLHLLRNAVDHGVESPLERSRAGKPAAGRVVVRAADREHHTEITVSDDGRGVDAEAVYAAAREAGRIGETETPPLMDLLTVPGFSTRAEATATSGRGVGLDLVRSVVEEFGGAFRLENAPGEGCAFQLEIPKLRAVNIVDALTVRAGERLFAFPIDTVVSSLGVASHEIQTAMQGGRYIRYLGEVVVLHGLLDLLGDTAPPPADGLLPVVIIQNKRGRIALGVSEFLGPQKLVNVPLDDSVFRVQGVAGTSVFSGGRLGLTLVADALIARALEEEDATFSTRERQSDAPARTRSEEDAPSAEAPADVPPKPKKTTEAAPASVETAGEAGRELAEEDVSDLLDELRRSLADLQDALLSLETAPEETEHLHRAFRLLHACKGNFTMLEAETAAELAHRLETILDYLRSERLALTPERMDLLLDGVTALGKCAEALPEGTAPPPELLDRLAAELETPEADAAPAEGELIGQAFTLSPTVELQVLSALKRGEHTYETYIAFEPGRQADFLVAYLILRRLGLQGTILASLPEVDEIEQGRCGREIKVLWSTALDPEAVEEALQELAPLYGLREWHTTPATIFRYEPQTSL